tara:strand:+ start:260 stop:571 length:312 start_codon:yes stop_codon:yes gene_type:complete
VFRFKIFISIIIFSTFLILTSLIKNETREVEKKIFNLSLEINLKEKDFVESQLDFSYLTSPAMIENKIEQLDYYMYQPMEYSKIFLDLSNFIDLKKKFVTKEK